jgi:hypothetical protein
MDAFFVVLHGERLGEEPIELGRTSESYARFEASDYLRKLPRLVERVELYRYGTVMSHERADLVASFPDN